MKFDVPFYSQKWNLSDWQTLGFQNLEDAAYWEQSCCGILSLKMAIDYFLLEKGGLPSSAVSEYIQTGVQMQAYTHARGWSHKGLAQLANHYGFHATCIGKTCSENLKSALIRHTLPIVSIKWAFENQKTLKEKLLFWKKFGGHLALVIGFEEVNGKINGFYVHHTSTGEAYNWQGKFIPLEQFKRGFTGRCIVVSQ